MRLYYLTAGYEYSVLNCVISPCWMLEISMKFGIFIWGPGAYSRVSIFFTFLISYVACLARVFRPFAVITIAFGYWQLIPTSTSLLQVKTKQNKKSIEGLDLSISIMRKPTGIHSGLNSCMPFPRPWRWHDCIQIGAWAACLCCAREHAVLCEGPFSPPAWF